MHNKKFSVEKKLYGSFGFIILLFAAFSIFVIYELNSFKGDVMDYRAVQEEIKTAKDLQLDIANVWQFITDASLTKDKAVIDEEAKPSLQNAYKNIDRLIELTGYAPDVNNKLRALRNDVPNMWDTGMNMFNAYLINWQKGNIAMDEYDKACEKIINETASVVKGIEERNNKAVEGIFQNITGMVRTTTIVVVIIGFSGIIAFFMLRFLRKAITDPLVEISNAAQSMASGNLMVDLKKRDSDDAVGALSTSMNKLINSLNEIIGAVVKSSADITKTVDVLKLEAEKTLQGAQSQAGQASQIATAAEEMTHTISDIARNAAAASETSTHAMEVAEAGKEIADNAMETVKHVQTSTVKLSGMIENLNKSTSEIGGIVNVIKDIADQTNLLALNAAIEAARAGEQGRGFAVVADEVRKLAERTIKATAEISGRIANVQTDSGNTMKSMEDALSEVTKATKYINNVGDALLSILSVVRKVRDQIILIATAVDEQSTAAEHISRNIEDTSAIAKDVEKMTEEMMRGVKQLTGTSEDLKTSVSGFRTRHTS